MFDYGAYTTIGVKGLWRFFWIILIRRGPRKTRRHVLRWRLANGEITAVVRGAESNYRSRRCTQLGLADDAGFEAEKCDASAGLTKRAKG